MECAVRFLKPLFFTCLEGCWDGSPDVLRSHTCGWSAEALVCPRCARGKLYEYHSASGAESNSAGGLFAEGAGDRRAGSRALRTSTEADGSSMVAEPGLQPWVRRTSIRYLRAVPAQAQVAAGFD